MSYLNPLTWFRTRPAQRQTPQKPDPALGAYWAKRDTQRRLEEQFLDAAPYELISPWSQLFDGSRLRFPILPTRMDYRQSPDGLLLSESQLDLIRLYSRWLYESNPYAQSALRGLTNYVIGKGFSYTVSSRRHAKAGKALLKNCNKFVEDVLNANRWWELERELFISKHKDGDCGLRLFPQDDGVTQLRVVEPDFIRGNGTDPDYLFGVLTAEGDRSTRLGYRVFYSYEQYEDVPADEMFLLINEPSRNAKRGLSDFFCVHEVLDDAAKLLRAGRQGEAVRQAIAYLRSWAASPPGAIQTLQAADEDYTEPRFNSNGNNTNESVHRVVPGEVIDIPKGLEMSPGPVGNAENMAKVLDASLKAAACRWNIPSWILTGETNANYASALVAEGPSSKEFERQQFAQIKEYCGILTRVMAIGVEQGILPQDTLEMVEVTAEGAPVSTRDLKAETEINSILNQNKILSRRAWAARENLDFDEQQDQIREEEQVEVTNPLRTPNESTTPAASYAREAKR